MQKLHPLLIGMPFTYKLVDFDYLKQNNIEPLLAYPEGAETIGEGQSVFYNLLAPDQIEKILESTAVDAIVCFNDNFIIQAGQLRTKYNICGVGYPEIKKYKVKSEMYKVLSPYITVPKTLDYHDKLSFEKIIESLGEGEYFIKPDNLAGAEGGCHIKDKTNYLNWKDTSYNPRIKYIIQNFHPYPLYHCELIVKKGEVKYIQARRYSYPNHHFMAGKIIASFPVVDNLIKSKIEQGAIKVQQLLGYNNGVMHTEFFLKGDQSLIFLETNIRQPGGDVNLIHKRRAGVSIETAMVLLELGKEINITLNEDELFDISGYIPIKQGRVTQIRIPKLKGEYSFNFRVKIGEIYNAPISASNTAASFLGYSSEFRDLEDDFFSLENSDIIEYF